MRIKLIIKICLAFTCLVLRFNPSYTQLNFYSDSFNGGVTGGGYNPWVSSQSGIIDINIPPECIIRKAYLFTSAVRTIGTTDFPEPRTLLIDNQPITIDASYSLNNNYQSYFSGSNQEYKTIVNDISLLINPNTSTIVLEPPVQPMPSGIYCDYYILVCYENSMLPSVSVDVYINSQNMSLLTSYALSTANVMEITNHVGLSINTSNICDTIHDGSYLFIDNEPIGLIGGMDYNNIHSCSGVSSGFFFQNNQLNGLGDDVANEMVSGSDGLVRIESYVLSSVEFNLLFEYQNGLPPVFQSSNTIHQLFLTYTSPCQPFEAILLTSDTTTCTNSSVQLGVTVPDTINATYEWLPQTNLSCYNCPNPVFLGDSTTNYTVRIWASDSCSKVLPVRVRVLPQPNFESIKLTENICGFETGSINGSSSGSGLPHTYQLNDGVTQNNFNFSNLEAGIYTITVTNANGCSRDSTVQILEVNNVQAAFSVNPNSGAAPLTVQTQNNSQNATEYQWFWEDEISALQNPSITLDTAGIYTLTLVAGNGAAHCNDTTSALIFVDEPFVVFAYSYVTDEADVYQIFLSGVSEYRYDLYALDGKLVYQKTGSVEATGNVDLWAISGVASGMYVFRVRVKDNAGNEQKLEGKVVVVR